MKNYLQNIKRREQCNMAILFLRLFIGGVMLLHMIGKLQDYDNYILNFQSILGFSQATSFAMTILFEGLAAVMIIVGIGTRLASLLMSLVAMVALCEAFFAGEIVSNASKVEFIYIGIYLTLVISGGGKYAVSSILLNRENVPKR